MLLQDDTNPFIPSTLIKRWGHILRTQPQTLIPHPNDTIQYIFKTTTFYIPVRSQRSYNKHNHYEVTSVPVWMVWEFIFLSHDCMFSHESEGREGISAFFRVSLRHRSPQNQPPQQKDFLQRSWIIFLPPKTLFTDFTQFICHMWLQMSETMSARAGTSDTYGYVFAPTVL